MADVTVSQFADVLKVPVDRLLVQLEQAGITVAGPDDMISDEAKMELLSHLRRSHGTGEDASSPRKITLKRKTQTELKLASTQGRARTVNVEVRVKRTYVKREVLEEKVKSQQEEIDAKKREQEEQAKAERDRAEAERREAERIEAENRRRIEEEAQARRAAEEARRAAEQQAREDAERESARRKTAETTQARAPETRARAAEPPAAESEADKRRNTKYGRAELHVAGDMSSRLKKKKRFHDRKVPVTDVDKFERETLKEMGMPKEIVMRHRLPQFNHLFTSDAYSAGYYSYLWSEVMDADTRQAFKEAGDVFDKTVAGKMKTFILAPGNTTDRGEAYRQFRGRDPDVKALLEKRGFPVK